MPVFEFTVDMSCESCASRIRKKLTGLQDKGVQDIDISVEKQLVKVTTSAGDLTAENLLEEIKKTGKAASIKDL